MGPGRRRAAKERLGARPFADAAGRITFEAVANAIQGEVRR